MFPIFIWLLVFSGISVSQAQNVLLEIVRGLVDDILKNLSNTSSQISLVKLLKSMLDNNYDFQQNIPDVINLLDPIDMTDICYYMYVGNINNKTVFSGSNATIKTVPGKSDTVKLVVIFHGWKGNNTFMPEQGIAKLLRKGYIVIIADYENLVKNPLYISPALRSFVIGNEIGKTLAALGIPASRMTFVGHSLGAHIGAAASDYLRTQNCNRTEDRNECIVGTMFGLDPVGPLISMYITPLSKKSANYVVVFHTSLTGIVYPIGHVDYYALDLTEACAENFGKNLHLVAIEYFVIGIDNPELYEASGCVIPSPLEILQNLLNVLTKSNPSKAYMNFNTAKSVRGIYCFTLDPKSPECTNYH